MATRNKHISIRSVCKIKTSSKLFTLPIFFHNFKSALFTAQAQTMFQFFYRLWPQRWHVCRLKVFTLKQNSINSDLHRIKCRTIVML